MKSSKRGASSSQDGVKKESTSRVPKRICLLLLFPFGLLIPFYVNEMTGVRSLHWKGNKKLMQNHRRYETIHSRNTKLTDKGRDANEKV